MLPRHSGLQGELFQEKHYTDTATLLLLPESACSVPGGTALCHTEIFLGIFENPFLNLK